MSLTVTEASNYTPVEAGTYQAISTAVIDMGVQETSYGEKHQVWIQWELDEEMENGERYTMGRRYTHSLSPKAALREDLDKWRGRAFTKEELAGFNLMNVLGAHCMLTVSHYEKDGRTYANVAGVTKLPKGMTPMDGSTELLAFDMDERDPDVFEKLPEWMQKLLKASPSWDVQPEPVETQEPDFDDSIPF